MTHSAAILADASVEATPLVSIVVPAYNHGGYLREAIDGILAQDYPRIELIVLNDGSQDDTEAVLRSYPAGRFHWETHANMGQSATLNKGWAMSRGEILGYLSADDALRPDAVSRSVACLQRHPEAVATYCDFELISADSQVVRRVDAPAFSYREMVEQTVCQPGPGAYFYRSAFEAAGPWNAAFRQMPDYEFWLRMGLLGTFHHIREPLAKFRVHEASQTYAAATAGRSEEPLRIMSEFFRRTDLPPHVRLLEPRAMCNAHLTAANLHWRAGRYLAATRSFAAALRRRPTSLLSPRTTKLVAHAFFSRWRFAAGLRSAGG